MGRKILSKCKIPNYQKENPHFCFLIKQKQGFLKRKLSIVNCPLSILNFQLSSLNFQFTSSNSCQPLGCARLYAERCNSSI